MDSTTTAAPAPAQGMGEELYGHLRNRDLLLRAAIVIAVSLSGLLFALAPAVFALLYAIQLGLAMVVTAPMMFAADLKVTTRRERIVTVATACVAMAVAWVVVLCVAAFVFFGPAIYGGVLFVGSAMPLLAEPATAIVLTYALCEAYPFLATLYDRLCA